jgi:hypothetical protein
MAEFNLHHMYRSVWTRGISSGTGSKGNSKRKRLWAGPCSFVEAGQKDTLKKILTFSLPFMHPRHVFESFWKGLDGREILRLI